MSTADITKPKGWWARNWLWAVPVGCLGMIALLIGFIAVIFVVVFAAIRSSEAYEKGFEMATTDPTVVAALGEPIEAGMLVTGSVNVSGQSGDADLAIPLSGPNGSGTLYIVAHKIGGQWSFDLAEVELAGQEERIDLLAEEPAAADDQ